jgi:type II secretory pathway pseudopilin PulG
MSDALLMPAPGAKAAKVCGILAIVSALTCAGIPIAIVLGIVALVQQGKAKRLAKFQPDVYEPVPATGLVTGIIGLVLPVLMLPVVGIASAVAIPAFLVHREQAREQAVQANLDVIVKQTEAATRTISEKTFGQVPSQDAILELVSKDPVILALKNPITPTAPALQRGDSGALGTVMVSPQVEEEEGMTTWYLQFTATVNRGGQEKVLQGYVTTHEQEHAVGHVEDGSAEGQPNPEVPADALPQPLPPVREN